MGSKGIIELREFSVTFIPQPGVDLAPSYYTGDTHLGHVLWPSGTLIVSVVYPRVGVSLEEGLLNEFDRKMTFMLDGMFDQRCPVHLRIGEGKPAKGLHNTRIQFRLIKSIGKKL
jgi:hypothetical protein